jgi:hypothetical protein
MVYLGEDGIMTNGLAIDEKEFMSLPQKKQMCVLYQNQVQTLKAIQSYKFNQKICLAWMAILTIAVGAGKFLGVL